eukprot:936720-Prymnesium_polylepis.1
MAWMGVDGRGGSRKGEAVSDQRSKAATMAAGATALTGERREEGRGMSMSMSTSMSMSMSMSMSTLCALEFKPLGVLERSLSPLPPPSLSLSLPLLAVR